jgi:hypothetical protein
MQIFLVTIMEEQEEEVLVYLLVLEATVALVL